MAKREPKAKKTNQLAQILRELEALRRDVEALKARPWLVPVPDRQVNPTVPFYPPIDPWCIPNQPNRKYPRPIEIWC